MAFLDTLTLTEGSVIERLRRGSSVELDPWVAHAALIYRDRPLAAMYRQYLAIGAASGLPLMTLTPTWRANPERLEAAGLGGRDVNGDAVRFLRSIRSEYAGHAGWLGGLTGCRGDAYRPEGALGTAEAARFHRRQVEALAHAGVDFLLASTLPAATEALGIARAMARTGVPYLLSFITEARGTLLDGTPLEDAIERIDRDVSPPPAGYLLNCVHWSALGNWAAHPRLMGLQANTSRRSARELEGRAELDTEAPEAFARGMTEARARCGLRVLGGCCGTDDRHIAALAAALTARSPNPTPPPRVPPVR